MSTEQPEQAAPARYQRASNLTWWSLGVLLAVTALAFFSVRGLVRDHERQQLGQQATEIASLVSMGQGEVRSALTVLSSLTAAGQEAAFDTASASLVTGNVRAIGQVDTSTGTYAIASSGGGDLTAGELLSGERGQLVSAALATDDVVTAIIHLEGETRLAYALRSPIAGTRVVFREAQIRPDELATQVRGQAFDDVELTVYASPTASPSAVLLSTVSPPLADGLTRPLAFGSDQWLLVTRAKDSLTDTVVVALPWMVLVVGVLLAIVIAALVEILARRRAYALALVDERTRDLQEAVEHQSRLEAAERSARLEAEAASSAKSDFLSRMSHELRTPLNGVLGFAQLMEMEVLSDAQRESLRQILKGGWHLLDLINEVLDITSIETGRLTISAEPVLARDVIAECVDLTRPLAIQEAIHLETDDDRIGDVHVLADPQRVKQILLNLLSNAVKYNRPGGRVSVSSVLLGDSLHINVVDTGKGIREQDLELLFAPFERLGAENSYVEGTGIGLALSERLAVLMKGSLTVQTAIDQGSTFTLALRVVDKPAESTVTR